MGECEPMRHCHHDHQKKETLETENGILKWTERSGNHRYLKEVFQNEATFKRLIREQVRELWLGNITIHAFYQEMKKIISQGYNAAWEEAQREVGAMTWFPLYQPYINELIAQDVSHLYGLAEYIEEHGDAVGGKLSTAQSRTWLWTNGYNKIQNEARVKTGEDTNLIWERYSKDGCFSCRKLEGRIYPAQEWSRERLYPQSPKLACIQDAKGIPVCRCRVSATSLPADTTPLGSLVT